jgi:hypothetical protein
MDEKRRCLICGSLAINNDYCKEHEEDLKSKTVREILQEEKNLIKLITKNGCINCPLFQTEFCKITDEHILCKNAEDEINLCLKYFKEWFDYELEKYEK